ncbi:MAG: tryptophan-rich sensory protein [Flavobacteriaceae bacterium TMED206]|nr:MAG: tryptophan-rich sensory protein [Flavobacteriaceae bacterium TMED206]|tara:strand:+ start:2015 stop:2491 length:477 start_codon:yes stop_codon:yes gene_type:complete
MNIRLFLSCLFGVLVSNTVGYLSSFATRSSVNTWYKYLNKPLFNPPDWIFMPVWIILYFLMGISFGIFFSYSFEKDTKRLGITAFVLQLFFNGMWSLVFFGLKNILLGLAVILILIVSIIFCIREFRKVNIFASYLMLPYLFWVCFASILNISIFIMN